MNHQDAEQLAQALLRGEISPAEFVARLNSAGVADVGDAQVDLDRRRRCGYPEVVFAQGKSVDALARIFRALLDDCGDAFATRVSEEQARELLALFPTGHYNTIGRTLRIPAAECGTSLHDVSRLAERGGRLPTGRVTIVTAGTSDLPVAEEARETALWMNCQVNLVVDVGVAGPHRLRARLHELTEADAIVVVAGMEGALPSVVGGYVACPVIAVPTSVGYGASFGGLAALLGMLNSCAANVAVVNIDAGFKAAYLAGLIAQRAAARREPT
jgi:NCAIR mutase (PurE)-related protein